MFRIIYSSVATELFGPNELKRLLMTARLRNQEFSVTGMLVYDEGIFLQALEGPRSSVENIFQRISADTRHSNITLLFRDDKVTERAFGQWSMGFSDSSGASQILKGFLAVSGGLRQAVLDRTNAVSIMKSYSSVSF